MASTGYGEPIQRFFKLKDGEKIVGAMSLDERAVGEIRVGRGFSPAAQNQTRPNRPCTPWRRQATATRSGSA